MTARRSQQVASTIVNVVERARPRAALGVRRAFATRLAHQAQLIRLSPATLDTADGVAALAALADTIENNGPYIGLGRLTAEWRLITVHAWKLLHETWRQDGGKMAHRNPKVLDEILSVDNIDRHKRYNCRSYVACLHDAARANWPQFHCRACRVFVPIDPDDPTNAALARLARVLAAAK